MAYHGLEARGKPFPSPPALNAGLLIIRRKQNQNFMEFSGANSRKNRPISLEKKSKLVEKSADFAGFSQEKSQNSQKNRLISRDFSTKESTFEEFSGENS